VQGGESACRDDAKKSAGEKGSSAARRERGLKSRAGTGFNFQNQNLRIPERIERTENKYGKEVKLQMDAQLKARLRAA
jgi:hypothetical protein